MCQTREYKSWISMNQRCRNKGHVSYHNYGARGIFICKRWKSFVSFYKDMGDRPIGYSLDRIDNEGNYNPQNCKWSSRDEQNNNKRIQKRNRSGMAGITKWKGKWRVEIRANNKCTYLGRTSDLFEAFCIRKSGENRLKHFHWR